MIDQFMMPNINALIDMGVSVHVACNFNEGNTCPTYEIDVLKEELTKLKVHCYQIDFSRKIIQIADNLKAYKQTKSLMKKHNFDVVHCHSPIGGVCGRLAGKATNTKVIYTAHGFHFYKGAPLLNWLLYYPIEKWLARYTDVLITLNKEDYYRAQKSFRAGKVAYIPGVGIDIKKLSEVDVDKDLKRKELGVPKDSFILLSVGELNKNKNHEVVIRALAQMKNLNIYYIICGQGSLANYLIKLSKDLGIDEQVHLLGYREDVYEICRVSDLFVFPSFREGLSVALMEAMGCGLPVICSNIRGNKDLIEDGKGGYLFEPDNMKELISKIIILIKNLKMREKYSCFNKRFILKFSQEKVIGTMIKIYREILF